MRHLGEVFIYSDGAAPCLFTENETNSERLVLGPNPSPYVKDGINEHVVHGRTDAVNPDKRGTKAAVHYTVTVGAGKSQTLRLRLSNKAPKTRRGSVARGRSPTSMRCSSSAEWKPTSSMPS